MRHTHLFSGAAAAVLAAFIVTASSAPASAHESLASSSPTEGQQFDTAPSQVELVFTDEVLPEGAAIVVVDEAGEDWVDGDVAIDGSTVTVPLAAEMPDAGYQVRWRVVSGDGHPISSFIPFTVGDAEPFTETGEAASTTPPDATDTDTAADERWEPAGLPAWGLVALGVGGAVVATGLFFLISAFIRRRRS